ncbi:MAG: crotonase/enoyl-CoA hydratase family protein [Pseudomonadota bacterium]
MSSLVNVEMKDHVAHVALNRPEKHNALSLDMFEAIVAAGESLQKDENVRAIVLSGEGPSFCAGLDFAEMQSLIADQKTAVVSLGRLFKRDEGPDNVAQRVAYVWQKIDVPVIAALHGTVYGGGMQIALGADIRIAAPDAKFSIMEIRYGLVPDMSITQTLPDIMPKDKALELTLTGRVFSSVEAENLGVATLIDDQPLAKAEAIAQEIAQKSPDAIRGVKKLYRESWREDADKTLALEEALQRELIGSRNQIEAVMASVQKRPANFGKA